MAVVLSWGGRVEDSKKASMFRTLVLRQVQADRACVNAATTNDDTNITRVKTLS